MVIPMLKGQGPKQQSVLRYLRRNGPATAREIAFHCDVPLTGAYGGVYKILHELPEIMVDDSQRPYIFSVTGGPDE